MINKIKQIKKDLWPVGCLEDGDDDPFTIYNDGYCKALEDYEKKIIKLLRNNKK
jgi:hypothetical protein